MRAIKAKCCKVSPCQRFYKEQSAYGRKSLVMTLAAWLPAVGHLVLRHLSASQFPGQIGRLPPLSWSVPFCCCLSGLNLDSQLTPGRRWRRLLFHKNDIT